MHVKVFPLVSGVLSSWMIIGSETKQTKLREGDVNVSAGRGGSADARSKMSSKKGSLDKASAA